MIFREGSLEAPKRERIGWESSDYVDPEAVDRELERVFEICHGCRRCLNLCNAFPTLFDLVDESDTLEIDGVDRADYIKVVNECYLCDLCAETKCPYLPPHEWAVDFPHLMLRAKARKFNESRPRMRDRILSSTEPLFKAASALGTAGIFNRVNQSRGLRKIAHRLIGIHENAPLPTFATKREKRRVQVGAQKGRSHARVALYLTCYGINSEPSVVDSLIKVLEHNGFEVRILEEARCCGMPKLELGDLGSVVDMARVNLPVFKSAVDEGFLITSIIPSCILMYRQEVPLLLPEDPMVGAIKEAFRDPFEILLDAQRSGEGNTEFTTPLGKVCYHAACHQRVQRVGRKTMQFLQNIPGTEVSIIERCSGHDGTYAVKAESYETAMKIAHPVVRAVEEKDPDTFGSDCPMAGRIIQHGLGEGRQSEHPIEMVARAYGLKS